METGSKQTKIWKIVCATNWTDLNNLAEPQGQKKERCVHKTLVVQPSTAQHMHGRTATRPAMPPTSMRTKRRRRAGTRWHTLGRMMGQSESSRDDKRATAHVSNKTSKDMRGFTYLSGEDDDADKVIALADARANTIICSHNHQARTGI